MWSGSNLLLTLFLQLGVGIRACRRRCCGGFVVGWVCGFKVFLVVSVSFLSLQQKESKKERKKERKQFPAP